MNSFPFPPMVTGAKMKWARQYGPASAGTVNTFGTQSQFYINAPYQPDGSGATIQPYGWDTFASVYAVYMARGVFIRVSVQDYDANGANCALALQLAPSSTNPTLTGGNPNSLIDQPFFVLTLLSPDGNAERAVIEQYVDFSKFEGRPKRLFDADFAAYSAAVGAVPTNLIRMNMAYVNNANNNVSTAHVVVELTFVVDFWERKILAQS